MHRERATNYRHFNFKNMQIFKIFSRQNIIIMYTKLHTFSKIFSEEYAGPKLLGKCMHDDMQLGDM